VLAIGLTRGDKAFQPIVLTPEAVQKQISYPKFQKACKPESNISPLLTPNTLPRFPLLCLFLPLILPYNHPFLTLSNGISQGCEQDSEQLHCCIQRSDWQAELYLDDQLTVRYIQAGKKDKTFNAPSSIPSVGKI